MKINTSYRDDQVIVEIIGAIDSFTYPIFAKEINILNRSGVGKMFLDFTNCKGVNVATIMHIFKTEKEISNRNGQFSVEGLDERESDLLDLMEKKWMSQNEKREKEFSA